MESWLLWINTLILMFLLFPSVVGGAFFALIAVTILILFLVVVIITPGLFEMYEKMDNETKRKIKEFLKDYTKFNVE